MKLCRIKVNVVVVEWGFIFSYFFVLQYMGGHFLSYASVYDEGTTLQKLSRSL